MTWLIAVVALVFIWVAISYNGLVKPRVQSDSAWADIDVQLRRRHDMIPNLVETVKGYAAYERNTLERVTDARARAMSAGGPVARAQAEGVLTEALKSLFVVAEKYPQLRAAGNFGQLQAQISEAESPERLSPEVAFGTPRT